MMPVRIVTHRRSVEAFWQVLLATARRYVKRQAAYAIELIRWPVFPVLYFVALYLTYSISGRETVSGYPVAGFLLVGVVGIVLWTSNLWASGYAIEFERREGTLPALFLSPASRSAVVFGYGAGSIAVMVVPTVAVLAAIVVALRIEFVIASPLAVVLAIVGMLLAAMSLGYVLAGFFMLTRRANVIANSLQLPIYILSGAILPVAELPERLQFFARMFPLSYGMDATRETLLASATVSDIGLTLIGLAGTSLVLLLVGAGLLRRMEHDARNGAELDFE